MKLITIGSGSSGNCYLIKDSSSTLLLDAGVPFKKVQKSIGFKTSNIEAVLITHEHLDHAKFINQYLDNGLNVYLTKKTQEALQLDNHYRLKNFNLKEPFYINNTKILAFENVHDAVEPCSFLIETNEYKLLYATDTKYIKYKVSGLTHIMLEGNYEHNMLEENINNGVLNKFLAKRITDNHMSIETSLEYLKAIDKSKLKEVILIHLSNENSNAEMFKEKLMGVTGAVVKVAGR